MIFFAILIFENLKTKSIKFHRKCETKNKIGFYVGFGHSVYFWYLTFFGSLWR